MKYIVKISPELSIKSRWVRKRAVINLRNNIKTHLEFNNIKANLTWNWDRINIDSKDNNNISNILLKIPGISNFLEVETIWLYDNNVESVEKLSLNEVFELIYTNVKDYYLDKVHNKTFSVRVKRIGNHSFKSIDLERFLWFSLLRDSNNSKVKLELPDIIVKIEIKDYNLYIVKNKVEGIWWYPVWFQDRVLSLISWGFDSWVSTYSMIKRWCEVDYLFFNLWWNAHELWVKQVSNYLWRNFSIPYKRAKFITVNFEEIVKELIEKVNHKYRWIILKRYMLKLASIISEWSHYALIKWDSLGQVSSQTLKNIHVIDKASNNLVFRPLISYNKQEIVDISKQIGTYNFACNMPEYCWVISDRPSVWAKLEDILLEEEKILDEVLLRAVENKKIEFVKDMMEQYKWVNATVLDVVFLPWDNEVIIDIREKTSIDKKPLIIENVEKIEIPFYDINYKFESLDNTKIYLLYCDKWILSNLHWLYLIEKWFQNVKIYRSIINDKSCSI